MIAMSLRAATLFLSRTLNNEGIPRDNNIPLSGELPRDSLSFLTAVKFPSLKVLTVVSNQPRQHSARNRAIFFIQSFFK